MQGITDQPLSLAQSRGGFSLKCLFTSVCLQNIDVYGPLWPIFCTVVILEMIQWPRSLGVCVCVGSCWCIHPVCISCSDTKGSYVTFPASAAAVFSCSQMLQPLFRLQESVEGCVSDSSPVSVWSGVWFTPDGTTRVTLCKVYSSKLQVKT